MAKLVCVKCECELRPEINGVGVIETASFGPYKIWHADLWQCPGCGIAIVAGFGQQPIVEHFEDFDKELKLVKETYPRIIYDNERPKQRDTQA